MKYTTFILTMACLLAFTACKKNSTDTANATEKENWISLFNGENLDGWEIKIRNYPLGENFANTFRVENGLLVVSYDGYENDFQERFAHIYTHNDYSHYKLRIEYRFVGEPCPGAPRWAYANNGAMLHAQNPASMAIDQDFPNSIEAQMLASDDIIGNRHTGSVCTPGTYVSINGEPEHQHCISSDSKFYPMGEWVTMEIEVYGDSLVRHIVNGDTVMTYTALRLDNGDVLHSGRIALQGEGHPTEFRKIEILELK